MSSITVAGITPTLSILGSFQEFIYDQNSSAFRLYNNFIPTEDIVSQTNFEYRNNTLSGFRWAHSTTDTDTIGQLKLQSFVSASSTGTDIISFNDDGSTTFSGYVTFPSILHVSGSTQTFLYNSSIAQFILENDAVNSNVAYVLNSDSMIRATFGYNSSDDETSIQSGSSLGFYINSPSTPQFKINSTTGDIQISTEVNASGNAPGYSFTLNNDYTGGFTEYVISQNNAIKLELGYDDEINISYVKTNFSFDMIINGDSTCIFNESNVDFNNNPIINATWNGNIIPAFYGGTGINNASKTITLGGNLLTANTFTTSGNFPLTLTTTASTNVTLPTSGTLVNASVTTLSSLSSIGTITAGTWNATPVTVVYGGTGRSNLTAHSLLIGNGSSGITQLTQGDNNTVLIGNTGMDPSFSSTPIVNSMTILNAPISSTDAITKGYADALTAGLFFKNTCYTATTANLNAAYLNGASGVGATLTNLGTLAAFSVDGQSLAVNSRILVKDQSMITSFQNGIYVLTTVGSSVVAWVLTRATDFDTNTKIQSGDIVPVEFGTTNNGSSWLQISTVNTIGTDAISFSPFTYSPAAFLQKVNNLSDLPSTTTARANLGLTDVATQSLTQYSVLLGGISNAITNLTVPSVANQVLLSGASTNPSWSTNTVTLGGNLVTSGANSLTLTTTGATNVTLPTTGTLVNNTVATLSSLSSIGTITTGVWNGSLIGLTYGGTAANLTASNGGIVYSTASALAILGGTATASRVLLSGSSSTPSWSTSTYPSVTTINRLLYASAGNVVTDLPTANNGILVTSSGGVPSIGSTLPSAVQGNITSTGTITSGTWNGSIISPTYGGTGINNASNTITLAGNLVTSGANSLTLTTTGTTNVTLPTTGTVATLSNSLNQFASPVAAINMNGNEIDGIYRLFGNSSVLLSIAANANLGSGATVSITGAQLAGTLTLNSGTTGRAIGILATVTLTNAMPSTNYYVFLMATTSTASGFNMYVTVTSSTTFNLSTPSTISNSATYIWNYFIVGIQ